jgi:hypothetical protein
VEAALAANRAAFKCWHPGLEPDLAALLGEAMDILEAGLEPPQ